MLKNPKKLDVLLIKQNTASVEFDIFNYFVPFNLVSYKSYGDALRTQDIYDLSIYTTLYLRPPLKTFRGGLGCMDAPTFLGRNAPKMKKKPDSCRVFRL